MDFAIGTTRVRTYALNHPGGCLAFRLENAGRVYVFATDHEHTPGPDAGLGGVRPAGADVLYTEGQYTLAEYEGREGISGDPPAPRRGWGHSPVEACVRTAVAAGVKQLHLGHREPPPQRRPDRLCGGLRPPLRRRGAGPGGPATRQSCRCASRTRGWWWSCRRVCEATTGRDAADSTTQLPASELRRRGVS